MITLFVNLDETEQYMVKIDSEFFCICAKTLNQVDKAINITGFDFKVFRLPDRKSIRVRQNSIFTRPKPFLLDQNFANGFFRG